MEFIKEIIYSINFNFGLKVNTRSVLNYGPEGLL